MSSPACLFSLAAASLQQLNVNYFPTLLIQQVLEYIKYAQQLVRAMACQWLTDWGRGLIMRRVLTLWLCIDPVKVHWDLVKVTLSPSLAVSKQCSCSCSASTKYSQNYVLVLLCMISLVCTTLTAQWSARIIWTTLTATSNLLTILSQLLSI